MYKILYEDSPEELEESVNNAILGGWEPLGGPFIALRTYGCGWEIPNPSDAEGAPITRSVFCQAMVKRKEAE